MTAELLAPAGGRDALIAAVQNGADAVYLGTQLLNARAGAANFDREELKWAVDYCHERGVSVHVTVNTVVKDGEESLLEQVAGQLAYAGADAAIVQDLGVAKALGEMLPSLKLHASTQMAVHNAQGVRFARDMGFSRVVLAREMSYEEIAACRGEGVELEAFAHGALCVSCSGQCLFSSLVGGRSGNRGQCAQPCRLPYRLDGAVKREGYLLSPRDLMGLGDLKRLIQAGVCSLKIEGRLKRPEYVAVVTGAYRRALDRLAQGREFDPSEETEALEQIFNRGGFTRGYGPGLIDRELMSPDKPNHAGFPVGRAERGGYVRLTRDVASGDSLAFRDASGGEHPVKLPDSRAGSAVRLPAKDGVRENDTLWRLVSERQMAAARESFRGERRLSGVTGRLVARIGETAAFTVSDGVDSFTAAGENVSAALSRPFDPGRARAQLEKTGGVPYRFTDVEIDADDGAFLSASSLNALRRDALCGLRELRLKRLRGCEDALSPLRGQPAPDEAKPSRIMVRVQSADADMLALALKAGADQVIFAPEDLTMSGLESVRLPEKFALALPETVSGGDLERLNEWAWARKERIEATLLSNVGHMAMRWPGERQLDAGLNIASRRALNACGGGAYTPSVELNAGEIRAIGAGGKRELIVYGRLRLMSLRHCPIRASLGGAHDACRRCDALPESEGMNGQRLIDRTGAAFPLRRQKSPGGCLIKVMNCVPLFLLRRASKLPKAASWRLILTDETARTAESVIRLHVMAARGADYTSAPEWAELSETPTTTGHYFRGVI